MGVGANHIAGAIGGEVNAFAALYEAASRDFRDLEAKANQVAQEEYIRLGSQAPALHPNVSKISGVICGVRIEEIEDPLMRNIRYLDKLVDELAKGRPMEKILHA